MLKKWVEGWERKKVQKKKKKKKRLFDPKKNFWSKEKSFFLQKGIGTRVKCDLFTSKYIKNFSYTQNSIAKFVSNNPNNNQCHSSWNNFFFFFFSNTKNYSVKNQKFEKFSKFN